MTDRERILDKVQKLLKLADPKANAGEAGAAAAKAQELLFQHNLSMADLRAVGEESEETLQKFGLTLGTKGFHVGWHHALITAIARHNFCRAVRVARTSRIVMVGEESNVEVAKYLYEYLSGEIRRLALDDVRRHCLDPHGGPRGAWVRNFAFGAVSEIANRLSAQRVQDEGTAIKANSPGTALVLASKDRLDAAVKKFVGKVQNDRSGPNWSDEYQNAHSRGRAAGRKIPLNKPIAGAKPARQIGGA